MQAILGFLSSNAILQTWKRFWFALKAAIVLCAVVFVSSEVTQQANHALFSYSKSAGEGAQGDALTSDPVAVRRKMDAGESVPAATRQQTVQYEKESALSRQASAEADAVNESEESLIAKKAHGVALNLAQQLKLKEFEVRRQELRIKEAEARIKKAESTNAEQNAELVRKSNDLTNKLLNSLNDGTFIDTAIDLFGGNYAKKR
jgi:hypothetical protein